MNATSSRTIKSKSRSCRSSNITKHFFHFIFEMSASGRVLPLARLCARQFSQSAVKRPEVPSPQFQKVKAKQQKFQVDDGVPVYIKGGMLDKVLYQATILGTTVGVILGIQVFVQLANK